MVLLFKKILKGASVAKFIDDIIIVLWFDNLVIANDVIRDADGGECLNFIGDIDL